MAKRLAVVGGVLVLALLAIGVVLAAQSPRAGGTGAATTASCADPTVIAAESSIPRLTVNAATLNVPPGEPAVVATVNGEPISAADLEQRVQIALTRQTAAPGQLTPGASGLAPTGSKLTPTQLRHDLLETLITQRLVLQEAVRQGITATAAQGRAAAQQQVTTFRALRPDTPSAREFQAYLCANGLTEATFVTDPRVVTAYQHNLMVSALYARIRTQLPADQQRNQAAVSTAIRSYVQRLRQSATITTALP